MWSFAERAASCLSFGVLLISLLLENPPLLVVVCSGPKKDKLLGYINLSFKKDFIGDNLSVKKVLFVIIILSIVTCVLSLR